MEEQNRLELNELSIDSLRVSAKWSTFLAIIGFIGLGFMLLAALLMGTAFSAIGEQPQLQGMHDLNPMMGFIKFLPLLYILIAVIYFFPVYYLFKYASGMKRALDLRNPEMIANSLCYLKSHHKFLGIMTIVMISLYIIFFIGIMIFAASMATSVM